MHSFVLVYQDIVSLQSVNQPVYHVYNVYKTPLTLTMRCHGNAKQRKTKTTTTEYAFSWFDYCM